MPDEESTELKNPNQNDKYSKKYQRSKLLFSFIQFILGFGFLILLIISGLSNVIELFFRQYFRNDYVILFFYLTSLGILEGILLFPLNLFSDFVIEHKYNLTDQHFPAWIWEQVKGILISYPLMLIIVTIFFALLRSYPQNWWIFMGIILVVFSVIIARLAPIFLFPIFYKFSTIEDQTLASKISGLCSQVGLKLEGVYQFNLSKTTRKANAAFTGIGKSKRIILGDTLLNNMESDEILAVLSHELGHYKLRHMWKGMATGILITFLGLYIVSITYNATLLLFHFEHPARIAALPIIGLLLTLYQLITAPLQNIYARYNERAADDFAIRLMNNPEPMISGLNKLADQNLSDRQPHPLIEFLFYSHPSIEKRIQRLRA